KGLNRISWNLRLDGPEIRKPPTEEEAAFGGAPRGPLVLPGTYIVRMTLGDKTQDQSVEVKLDPNVKVPSSDLQAALEMQTKLRDMQSTLNSSLRYLDSVEEQLKHTQTTMKTLNKEPDKDLIKALEDWIKQVDALQDQLVARTEGLGLGGRSQVADDIGQLFFTLDTNAAPTLGQRQYFGEIQTAYTARVDEVNKFIRTTVPQWNEKLTAWNAPTLTTRK
ncbi:MAG TPA: hypothetical protein VIR01_10010, partial [Pyrinomonadaceae bacterium]